MPIFWRIAVQTAVIEYYDQDVLCKGWLAFDPAQTTPQPTVLIAHAFDGITDHIRHYAMQVVAAGYVAFCVDLFGYGKTAGDMDSCMALIMPFLNDRALLQQRILAGFNSCKEQAIVDSNQIVAMGFCFGGTSVLDLARSGASVKGVACLHGVLTPPQHVMAGDITAKVLILNGYDDPQIGKDQLAIMADEFNTKNVDWQFIYFSHTQHAYTEPHADKIGGAKVGRVYNADSAGRAWQYCQVFFKDVLN